jgi:hypothetical protein
MVFFDLDHTLDFDKKLWINILKKILSSLNVEKF